jgi:deoxyribodipyrimidine photo-lyase
MSKQLVWFRNDLRTHDNPALFNACDGGHEVIAIYIATPKQWKKQDDAEVKQDFWRRNLEILSSTLSTLNCELRYFEVDDYQAIPILIKSLCLHWKIDNLFFNNEYPVYEQKRDHAVVNELVTETAVSVSRYDDQLLVAPKRIRSQSGEPYKVFTPFSKQARLALPYVMTVLPVPEQQKTSSYNDHPKQKALEQLTWPNIPNQLQSYWKAGEDNAYSRLVRFCQDDITRYKQARDIPALRATSKVSTYLASGVLSIRQCWLASEQYCEPNEGVTVWQTELLWREFYKHILIDYPHVSKHVPWKHQTEGIPWRNDAKELVAWQQGNTGYPLIDAAMKQLLQCGWMHNRLRMIVAMFLTKHLLIDWRLGEQWFMQHLIDGDLSANNGGWQWSASTGTDSVPYFRIFNPVTQSERFDSKGEFIKQYLPQLSHLSAKDIHNPKPEQRSDYVMPIVDLKFGRERALNAFKSLS